MVTKLSNKNDDDIVIVCALRTPLTKSGKGGLAKVPAHELLSTVVKGILDTTNINGSCINDICVGNVLLPSTYGYTSLRMGLIANATIPASIPTIDTTHNSDTNNNNFTSGCSFQTVNRQCASSLQAISIIANSIRCNEISIGIGAGVESMSYTPMNSISLPDPTKGDTSINWNLLQQQQQQSSLSNDAMDCILPMGITSDTIIHKYKLDRIDLDNFAVQSHKKAYAAQTSGKFISEIVSCNGVTQDDGIRSTTTTDILTKLKPIFTPNGHTTAGNSSQTTDGASAVLLMKRSEAMKRNLPIIAIWHGYTTASVPPSIMGIGPIYAIPKLLYNYNLTINDIDIFEINEAFASQALYCINYLNIPQHKVNPNGGSIALGHPLGATGARLVTTLIPELHRQRKRYGIVSMCIGSGMGAAALIEIESTTKSYL